jgi:hypothetical protein
MMYPPAAPVRPSGPLQILGFLMLHPSGRGPLSVNSDNRQPRQIRERRPGEVRIGEARFGMKSRSTPIFTNGRIVNFEQEEAEVAEGAFHQGLGGRSFTEGKQVNEESVSRNPPPLKLQEDREGANGTRPKNEFFCRIHRR